MGATFAQLPPAYELLDELLIRRETYYPRHKEPDWTRLQQAFESIESALWERSSRERSRTPPAQLAELAEHPVFVVGYYKSGTTLLTNLLDGHPEVLVLPGEWRHFANPGAGEGRLRSLHARAIRNSITPYGLPPRWLLGPPSGSHDPYGELGRLLVGFARARGSADVLAAGAQAFAAIADAAPRHWVEKTPTQEFHLDRILSAYPDACVVHIVRDPRSTVRAIFDYQSESPIVDPLTAAAELSRSFEAATAGRRQLGKRYHVVRYEDLVTDTGAVIRGVADAIDVGFDDSLLVPTAWGRASIANAGQPDRRVSGHVHMLSLAGEAPRRRDRLVVDALVGSPARALGYDTPAGSSLVAASARAALYARYRLRPALQRVRTR